MLLKKDKKDWNWQDPGEVEEEEEAEEGETGLCLEGVYPTWGRRSGTMVSSTPGGPLVWTTAQVWPLIAHPRQLRLCSQFQSPLSSMAYPGAVSLWDWDPVISVWTITVTLSSWLGTSQTRRPNFSWRHRWPTTRCTSTLRRTTSLCTGLPRRRSGLSTPPGERRGRTRTVLMMIWSLPRNSVSSESKPGWVRNQLQNIFAPTDNKLAMKLFGSKKALMKERVRQKAIGHWIIHPCSSFR